MEPIINRTEAPAPARRVPPVSNPSSTTGSEESPATNQISDTSSLVDKIAASGTDLRADEVERGKRLIADPNYPSDDVLEKAADGLLRSDDFRGAL